MQVSDRRRAANRLNASRSTGPTTVEGKRISRGNALKHGLTAEVLPFADEAMVHERAVGVYYSLKPQNGWQAWVCAEIVTLSIKIDRVREIEKHVRKDASERALDSWDVDQRDEANRLGGRLARDPARVVGQLRRSVAGSEWLIDRWAMLASVAARHGWTEEQKSLANDLLGTPPQLRGDAPGYTVDAHGQTVDAGQSEAALAAAQLAELHQHRDRVVEADEMARSLALADLNDLHNRDLIRLGRYERSLQRKLERHYEMSQFESPQAAPDAKLAAAFLARFPVAATEPSPPAPLASLETLPAAVAPEPAMQPESPTIPPPEPLAPLPDPVILQNEPIPAPPVCQNEPIPAGSWDDPLYPEGFSPILKALLEEGMPDPDTLDTEWCREYIATNLDRILSSDLARSVEWPDVRRGS